MFQRVARELNNALDVRWQDEEFVPLRQSQVSLRRRDPVMNRADLDRQLESPLAVSVNDSLEE
eukprot:2953984-Rhodomonas_salina.2